MLCKRSLCLMRCPSVTFVDSVETNKPICVFHHWVSKPFYFFHIIRYGNILTGIPTLTGVSNAGGIRKSRDCRRIAGYRSMTGGVRTTCGRPPCSLPHRSPRITASTADHDEEKRTEQNLFVYAAVNLKRK